VSYANFDDFRDGTVHCTFALKSALIEPEIIYHLSMNYPGKMRPRTTPCRVSKRLGSPYRSGGSPHWLKVKNPKALAVKREAEEDWGR
jgi:hypothetical protein